MNRPDGKLSLCHVLAWSMPCCAWDVYPSTLNRWADAKTPPCGGMIYRFVILAYLRKTVLLRLMIIDWDNFFPWLWRVETLT
ncbi:hypothetical protein BD769DRAFT_644910 [Suillus cothurnatus]|nr:hypothetical protein BD769DRAFT_644910 [Suillus cothurnatus]